MKNIIKKETKALLMSNCLEAEIRDVDECIKFIIDSKESCYDMYSETVVDLKEAENRILELKQEINKLRQELMKYKNNRIVRILIKLGVIHV